MTERPISNPARWTLILYGCGNNSLDCRSRRMTPTASYPDTEPKCEALRSPLHNATVKFYLHGQAGWAPAYHFRTEFIDDINKPCSVGWGAMTIAPSSITICLTIACGRWPHPHGPRKSKIRSIVSFLGCRMRTRSYATPIPPKVAISHLRNIFAFHFHSKLAHNISQRTATQF